MDRRSFLQGAGAFALAGLTPAAARAAPAFTALGAPVALALPDGYARSTNVVARIGGGYLAAWSSIDWVGGGFEQNWYARRFAADGTPASPVHRVEDNAMVGATLVATSDGNALAIGSGTSTVTGRIVTDAGFGARSVTIGGVGKQMPDQPLATRLADGTILVVWGQEKVYGRIIADSLVPVGKAFLIANGPGVQRAYEAAVAPLASGGAVVVMEVVRSDGLFYIAQRIRAGGGTVGPPLMPPRLAAAVNKGVLTGVVAMPQGRFALLWHSIDGAFGGHIYSDDGRTVAEIATVRWPIGNRSGITIPAVASGNEIVVAPAAGGVTLTSFDGATGRRTRPFTTIGTGFGDTNALARLSNGTFVASTTTGDRGSLLRFKMG